MSTREDILSLAAQILALLELHGDDFHICERCGHQEDAAFKNTDLFGFIKDAAEAHLAAAPTRPAAEAPGQEPVEAAGDVSPSYAIAKVIAKTVAASGVTSAMVTEAYRIAPWVGPDIIREMLKAALVSAPPTYADAEAKGFERGIEAAASQQDQKAATAREYAAKPVFSHEKAAFEKLAQDYDMTAATIRSLASPAPKGET